MIENMLNIFRNTNKVLDYGKSKTNRIFTIEFTNLFLNEQNCFYSLLVVKNRQTISIKCIDLKFIKWLFKFFYFLLLKILIQNK